jgi:hypothetical protein
MNDKDDLRNNCAARYNRAKRKFYWAVITIIFINDEKVMNSWVGACEDDFFCG